MNVAVNQLRLTQIVTNSNQLLVAKLMMTSLKTLLNNKVLNEKHKFHNYLNLNILVFKP